MKILLFLCFLSFSLLVFAHEGHETKDISNKETIQEDREHSWTQWVGSFHLMFLHFPIALINVLAISELLWIAYKKPIFKFSSQFLLFSAAIIAPPTALLGLIYSYSAPYEGLMQTFLWWHMCLGLSTAIFAPALAMIKEKKKEAKLYYVGLCLLVILLNSTSFFGGEMTFKSL